MNEPLPDVPSGDAAPGHDEVADVWERHPNEEYRRDMSHWRGHGRWAEQQWERIGQATLIAVERAAAMAGRPVPDGALLEWGPGGGSNLIAFAPLVRTMYGVDISAKNLDECARLLAGEEQAATFQPVLLDGDPASVAAMIHEPIDLFVSTAVFQHFPSAAYGGEVLATVARLAAPGALGCVQIRYDDDTPKYRSKAANYFSRHVTFTSYPWSEYWDLLVDVGFEPLAVVDVDSAVNYATFCFLKPG